MTSILIYPNVRRDPELNVTNHAIRLLSQAGKTIYILENSIPKSLQEILDHRAQITRTLSDMDLLLVLGGDGTILNVARPAAEAKLPILGINLGKVGFMAELEQEELKSLPQALDGSLRFEQRMMLGVQVFRGDQLILEDHALNDAVVTKGAASKIIDLEISADGTPLFSLLGDGAVVATPTGSTAYSMSAGGPIVEPMGENLIVTPICTYALHARSFVFSRDRTLRLRALNLQDRDAYLSIDGREAFALEDGDIVLIRRSPLVTKLVRFKTYNFYEIMKQKLLIP